MSSGIFELLSGGPSAEASQVRGVAVAIVTNNKDDEGMGRIKVKFPWLSDEEESWWARVATPMAGKDRGIYFLPEVDDEVLVAFEHGDIRSPVIVGSMWNGVDNPPTTNSDGKNDVRMIRSRSGHEIRLNDANGQETVEIKDKNGNSMVIATADDSITISCTGPLKIEAREIEITARMGVKVQAGTQMDLKATAQMNATAAMINLN
jgi:uncharacterized protein involved in type VI secretion and phage assembly